MAQHYKMGRFGGGGMFPPVIKGLIIANAAVYIFEMFFGGFSFAGESLKVFMIKYLYLNPLGTAFIREIQQYVDFYIWQIVTYQFLHGGFSHIFFNMIMLWMFGIELENLWGGRKFFIFYILAGIGAGIVQLLISPMLGQGGPTIGASGSIYGVFLAFALSFPDRHIMIFPFFIPIKAKYLIIILVVMDFFMGFSATSTTAHFAHIGGAASGWLLLRFGDKLGIYRFLDMLFPPAQQQSNWNNFNTNTQSNAPSGGKVFKMDWFKKQEPSPKTEQRSNYTSKFHVNGEEIDQSKIDEILDKISATGYQNLTEREKSILFELSQKLK